MTQKNDNHASTPKDIDEDLFKESDEQACEEETTDGLEPGNNAEAMTVSLKRTTRAGDDCVEVYAHGETYAEDGTEKTQQTIHPARVTERALTMFPLVSASCRAR